MNSPIQNLIKVRLFVENKLTTWDLVKKKLTICRIKYREVSKAQILHYQEKFLKQIFIYLTYRLASRNLLGGKFYHLLLFEQSKARL